MIPEQLTPETIAELCAEHLDPLELSEVLATLLRSPERFARMTEAMPERGFDTGEQVARWVLRVVRNVKAGGVG